VGLDLLAIAAFVFSLKREAAVCAIEAVPFEFVVETVGLVEGEVCLEATILEMSRLDVFGDCNLKFYD
jgi:hypothetical protein